MKKCGFIIPTHNRPKCVEYYLNQQGRFLEAQGIEIIIFDSSTNYLTLDIVNNYNQNGGSAKYDRYIKKNYERAIDEKVFTACLKYCNEYEYIWLSSDGTVVDAKKVLPIISNYLDGNTDILVYSRENTLGFNQKRYTDPRELFREQCWRMTLLQSVIVSKRILQIIIDEFPFSDNDKDVLWVPMSYFKVLANNSFVAEFVFIKGGYFANPKRDDSFWRVRGDALWQWGKAWCDAIDGLPSIYDQDKDIVLKSHDKNTGIFNFHSLETHRKQKSITFLKVLRYQKYLKRVTKTPVLCFYMAAFHIEILVFVKFLRTVRLGWIVSLLRKFIKD